MSNDFFSFREKMIASKPAPPAGEPLTVLQLTQQIDQAIKTNVPATVRVRGETSNVKFYRESGVLYFTIKDESACIDCVMFRQHAAALKFELRVGMEILVTGRVAVRAERGRYQLNSSKIEPLGHGSIELAFRQLHEKLQLRGLFDPERKKPLPRYPRRIVLVTSRQTAALQDMLKVLRRYPHLQLHVYHVPVQGDGSAERIAEAITTLHLHCQAKRGRFDLILLGRGGGSAEDLWEFNEEVLALAMAECCVPIITGIGHEVDKSIADFVADHWAHTPTEAAQVAVGQWRAASQVVQSVAERSMRMIRQRWQSAARELTAIERHEFFRRPLDRVQQLHQRLDDRHRGLATALNRRAQIGHDRLNGLQARLLRHDPRHSVALLNQRLGESSQRLHNSMRLYLRCRNEQLEARESLLTAISPQSVLRRGFTITTRKKDSAIVRSAAELRTGDVLITRFSDGQSESTVRDTKQLRLFE